MNTKANNDKTSAFSFDSIEDIHEEIQEESSAPSTAAMEAAQEIVVEKAKETEGTKDSKGVVFDPKLHAVNSEGEPSKTPLGKFRKRRGLSTVSMTNKAIKEQQQTAEQKQSARVAGQLAADMFVGTAVTVFGEEWIPVGPKGKQEVATFNEHENLRRAFSDYFEAKGISDFPPGMALSIAVTGYMIPRLAGGKETKSRLAKAKVWITEKYQAMKDRSKKDAAQPDTGDDRKRKDDTSEAASGDKFSEKSGRAST